MEIYDREERSFQGEYSEGHSGGGRGPFRENTLKDTLKYMELCDGEERSFQGEYSEGHSGEGERSFQGEYSEGHSGVHGGSP